MTNDPLDRYGALLRSEKAPDRLRRQVLEQARARQERDARADSPTPAFTAHAPHGDARSSVRTTARPAAQPPTRPTIQPTAHRTRPASPKRSKRTGFAIAACAVLALGAGALAIGPLTEALNPPSATTQDQQAASAVPAPFDFVVRAYAASTDTLLTFGQNRDIVFDRNMDAGLPSKADGHYQAEGYFTGCMFRIEADDVVSVTASIDKGQLYRYTFDEFVKSSDPDRWAEALSWKPGSSDGGGAYSGYDYVQPQVADDGADRLDPDKLCRVALCTLLGSETAFDVDAASGQAASDHYLGIWTNIDYPDPVQGERSFDGPIDTLDGARLTITLTFADGSSSTKVIELHSADMRAKLVDSPGSAWIQVLPEIVDLSTISPEQEQEDYQNGLTTIHSLYGTIVDESYQTAA